MKYVHDFVGYLLEECIYFLVVIDFLLKSIGIPLRFLKKYCLNQH